MLPAPEAPLPNFIRFNTKFIIFNADIIISKAEFIILNTKSHLGLGVYRRCVCTRQLCANNRPKSVVEKRSENEK